MGFLQLCSCDPLRRRAVLTQLPSAVAKLLARQTSLLVLDWQGEPSTLFYWGMECCTGAPRLSVCITLGGVQRSRARCMMCRTR